MPRLAVFLDRDNTLIEDPGFISSPDQVHLKPGAAAALRQLNKAGHHVVVVTNQSGVARGHFDEDTLQTIHQRMRDLFAGEGARIDAVYACPYLPGDEAKIAAYRRDSDLRKPKPGMLLLAAGELDLDLTRSWMIGDSLRDVQAGRAAGCRTIMIDPDGPPDDKPPEADAVLPSLADAVRYLLSHPGRGSNPHPADEDPAAESTSLLRQILTTQQQQLRAAVAGDFSVLSLFGAIVQIFALAFAVWGLFALIEGGDQMSLAALLRFLLAIFAQLLALTLFFLAKQR